jgi:hypothetical protein
MSVKPFQLQAPEQIAKEFGGNKQKIAQAIQTGRIDPTAGALAGMFIDEMRSAQAIEQAPKQTVAQQVFAPTIPPVGTPPPPMPGAPPMGGGAPPPPMPQGGPPPMPMPQGGPPMAAAEGGLMASGGLSTLPVPNDMFDEPDGVSMAKGGIIAFDGGGSTGHASLDLLADIDRSGYEQQQAEEEARKAAGYVPFSESDVAKLFSTKAPKNTALNAKIDQNNAALRAQQEQDAKVRAANMANNNRDLLIRRNSNVKTFGGTPVSVPAAVPVPKPYERPKPSALAGMPVGNLNEEVKKDTKVATKVATVAPKVVAVAEGLGKTKGMPIDISVKGHPLVQPGQYFTYGGKDKGTVYRQPQPKITAPAAAAPVAGKPRSGLTSIAPNPKAAAVATPAAATAAPTPGKPGEYYGMSTDLAANMRDYLEKTGGASPVEDRYKAILEARMSPEAIEKQKKNDLYAALGQMGFSMAATKSPYFLQAVGEAGQAAIPGLQKAAEARRADEAENIKGLYGFEAQAKSDRVKAYEVAQNIQALAAKGIDTRELNALEAQLKREGYSNDRIIAAMHDITSRAVAETSANAAYGRAEGKETGLSYEKALSLAMGQGVSPKELKQYGGDKAKYYAAQANAMVRAAGGGGGGGGAVDPNNPLLKQR